MHKLDNQLITIFGGGGFVGRYVAEHLLALGARVRVAQRDPAQATFLRPLANLGYIQFVRADVRDPASTARALYASDAVINLTGSFDDMQAVHADGAAHIAQASAQAGVRAVVHLSAIGADAQSPSLYGRTKAAGEQAMTGSFPKTVILRPSIIFGREDQFVNRFAAMVQHGLVPVVAGHARFQPVYVGDVAAAVVRALAPRHAGQTFELAGPKIFTMNSLLRWLAEYTDHHPYFMPISGRLVASLPFSPISHDQLKMLSVDNVAADGALGLADLGIIPTAIENVAADWLVQYRRNGRFSKGKSG